MSVYRPLALKLHAYGLNLLHDPNWTGMDLYDHFKKYYRGQKEPLDLFRKPIKDGFLYQLGYWLFEKYLLDTSYREGLGGEYLVWYADELLGFLETHEVDPKSEGIEKLQAILDKIGNLYDADEDAYFRLLESYRHRSKLFSIIDRLIEANQGLIETVAPCYANNYAERVFHDRELCEFISLLLITIGFDGSADDGPPQKWIDRPTAPSWLARAVTARERGKCAQCGTSITDELGANPHLDHIVPLAQGGCSDMVNYQLLCAECNTSKSSNKISVNTSIPPYLQRRGEG